MSRLADLEAEYTQEHHGVVVIPGQLFTRLRPNYERRGTLKLKIQYQRHYLDTLLIEREESAEAVKQDHDQARAETERDYTEAAV